MKIKISKSSLIRSSIFIVLGIIIGWFFFGRNSTSTTENTGHEEHQLELSEDGITWTCSMHPQIKMDKPGNCPICGMTLIPLETNSSDEELSVSEIKMSKNSMMIAEVETVEIKKVSPYKEVYFPGKVKADERNIAELTARFGGRIEQLYINFTGQEVSKNEKLASIYSPDLVTAQKELFEAMKYMESNPLFYTAAKNKLKLWDLTNEQIEQIEKSGEPIFYFDVVSPINGTVTMRHVALGDYVKEGTPLFEVIDLSHVWVMFDAYESDIPWVKLGDNIEFTVKSLPRTKFNGKVTFIDPVVNSKTRVAYVRTELDNPKDLLKPEMFASGILKTMLPGIKDAITVPKSAILWTGKRAIVYVRVPNKEMTFEHREIELGEDAGAYYIVLNGLAEGEIVVANGVFKIDAAAQLLGKQSMMTPAGGKSSLGGHAGMDMGGDKGGSEDMKDMPEKDEESLNKEDIPPAFKKQLAEIANAYLEIKDALTNDEEKLGALTDKMKKALENTDMKLLTKNEQHMVWMSAQKSMLSDLEKFQSKKDIEEKRKVFAFLSNDLINTLQVMGLDMGSTPLYIEYCPMVDAYWLSTEKEIRNPYYGEKMIKCGEVKGTL
jgi:membrane fusion protein, copper/silver efflux system